MIKLLVITILVSALYCLFLWRDKRKQRLREEELNDIRQEHLTPMRFKAGVPDDIQPLYHPKPEIKAFTYVGEYRPGKIYKNGDIIKKGNNFYLSIDGRLELIGA